MNKLIILILTLTANIALAQSINKMDANGKRHGIWKKNFNKTNVLRYEGEFNHGKEIGTFKFYKNINGKPVLTATRAFNPNIDLAEVTFYSSKQKVISKGKMQGKIYVGKWLYFHNKSKEIMTEEYYNTNGKLDGIKKVFYLNGKVAEQSNYVNGELEGESRWFSETGKVIRIFNYRNNELHGSAKIYNTNGTLKMEGDYQKDRRHGIWKFYKNGKLDKEEDFTRRSKNPKGK